MQAIVNGCIPVVIRYPARAHGSSPSSWSSSLNGTTSPYPPSSSSSSSTTWHIPGSARYQDALPFAAGAQESSGEAGAGPPGEEAIRQSNGSSGGPQRPRAKLGIDYTRVVLALTPAEAESGVCMFVCSFQFACLLVRLRLLSTRAQREGALTREAVGLVAGGAAQSLQMALEAHLRSSSVAEKQAALGELRARLAYDFSGTRYTCSCGMGISHMPSAASLAVVASFPAASPVARFAVATLANPLPQLFLGHRLAWPSHCGWRVGKRARGAYIPWS